MRRKPYGPRCYTYAVFVPQDLDGPMQPVGAKVLSGCVTGKRLELPLQLAFANTHRSSHLIKAEIRILEIPLKHIAQSNQKW